VAGIGKPCVAASAAYEVASSSRARHKVAAFALRAVLFLSSDAERRARTASRPNRSVIGPSGEAQGVAPHSDSSEEMALAESSEVIGLDFFDASLINFAIGNQSRLD
jgi:hypothetical protein